ncbi:DNA repair helicase [Periconia macrospinosa]|uniref:ATP-dependent DNA helicase CHL1 n=1 Tax=Periconia macrospinosa TaxID=97972 RepID=A0A2V1DVG1_9PLEO|nr:DNA repair helicase [Periconia macrospinosa]
MEETNRIVDRDFHHPFEPYDIQKQFMEAVYQCLENGQVGIFESPTGTGKSLSLICGALTWLRDYKKQKFEDGYPATHPTNSDEPAWMLDYARKQKRQEALNRRQELEGRIARVKAQEKQVKESFESGGPRVKRQKLVGTFAASAASDDDVPVDEARFALDDYDSEADLPYQKAPSFDDSGLSVDTQRLMQELGMSLKQGEELNEGRPNETTVFFCSRTHSQLSQFSNELRRVRMPSAFTPAPPTDGSESDLLIEDVKHITLGSRKNLCINPAVRRLGNATAINERCLELQQPGTSPNCKCPFMPNNGNQALVNDFRDYTLAKIRDIEDLGMLGKRLGICPYYASRPTIKDCEVVTLPYPLLLQKSARVALDLSLKDHIVIIDEAHNLMDAIVGIYSMSVTLTQVQQARMQLTVYLQKFRNRLKGKNRVYVAQTIRIMDSIITYLQTKDAQPNAVDGVVELGELMSGKGVDLINIYKLNTYLQESKLARKVDGYTVYSEQSNPSNQAQSSTLVQKQRTRQTVPVLTHVQSFLLSLMNPSNEGRFFYSREESSSIALKYLLLDPTFHFKDIVDDARAVVLAGGTMSPMSDYEKHLLSYLDASRIKTLSCGHVVPPSNLLAVPVVQTHSGADFNFTFEKRNSEQMMIDLGHTLLGIVQHIPDGVVVFFPSYTYLDTCIAAWKRLSLSFDDDSCLEMMRRIKPIFFEQRSQSAGDSESDSSKKETTVDSVLSAYSNTVTSGNGRGALLFAVIGGTLSEGINFSDSLGRGVVVVGLPFPNPHSAEWKAKMQYISSKAASVGQDGKAAARDFYENACMRAVNQCVGRAIRHRADYAAILMLDSRYGGQRIQAKLPGWIRGSLTNGTKLGEVKKLLDDFFKAKRT